MNGDNGGNPGPDPNTNLLTDYSGTFNITTDTAGSILIEGRAAAGNPVVFINGLEVGDPATRAVPEPSTFAVAVVASAALLLPGRRRRRR